jgi:hypothetical protein
MPFQVDINHSHFIDTTSIFPSLYCKLTQGNQTRRSSKRVKTARETVRVDGSKS